MEDVELVEVGVAPGPDPGPDGRDEPLVRLGPLLRRWWPVPVAVVLAVVGVGVVIDARQDAALARIRETPYVIRTTVEPPLEAVEWGTPATVAALYGEVRTADGLVVGQAEPVAGEPVALAALDAQTGAERWRVDLQDDPGTTVPSVSCTADGDPARTAWCVVLDGEARQLVAVDLAAREVRTTRALPDGVGARVSGDVLYTTRLTADTIEVVAADVSDGTVRWRAQLPDRPGDVAELSWPSFDGTHLWVWGGTEQWALDPADGSVRAHALGLTSTRGGRLVEDSWAGVPHLVGVDGTQDVDLPGSPFWFSVDDGSVPDVLLVSGVDGVHQVVRAVDAGTGETLWQRPPSAQSWPIVLLLDGAVYGSDDHGMWALDLRTGEERWATEEGGGTGNLMTDGVHLLHVETAEDGEHLVAYDLHDGERLWSEPLPADAQMAQELGGQLVVVSESGSVSVLR